MSLFVFPLNFVGCDHIKPGKRSDIIYFTSFFYIKKITILMGRVDFLYPMYTAVAFRILTLCYSDPADTYTFLLFQVKQPSHQRYLDELVHEFVYLD